MATTTKLQKLTFQWDIKNIDDCDLVIDEFFDSPLFSATDPALKSDWKLRLYPAGFKERTNLTLVLLRLDSGPNFYIKHLIAFLNRNGNRIDTVSFPKLCETGGSLQIPNIVEIKKHIQRYTDGGVLSVLCEVEIFERNNEIEGAAQEKHLQMYGTSLVIHNMRTSPDVELKLNRNTIFYLPYGKLFVCLKGTIVVHASAFCTTAFQIIDDDHPEIEEVPIKIILRGTKSTWKVKRVSTVTVTCNDIMASVQISSRCMVDSKPNALPVDITPYKQRIQSDYRNIFSQSEGGDISIVVDETTLRVHKNILSNRCPVFAAMFSHEWREQTSPTVTINDFDYKTILAMIEFIYFGGNDDCFEEDAVDPVELLKAADMYQLEDLKRKCEQRICQGLQKNNVACCMVLSEAYHLPELLSETFAFMNIK